MTTLRQLNDYESMLATSTCNCGMLLSVPSNDNLETILREAWSRCVAERKQLQVKLVAKKGDKGPLGQRYGVTDLNYHSTRELFVVEKVSSKDSMPDLISNLKQVGTTALDIFKGSFYILCTLEEATEDRKMQSVQIIISLCHALSDGPGALEVAKSFLVYLGDILNGESSKTAVLHPLTDLQACLLGHDYAKDGKEEPAFKGSGDFAKALELQPPRLDDFTHVLPPEGMQGIPHDPGLGGPSCVDCIHFSLSAPETSMLRTKCRSHETTIQGVLVAAALKARLTVLADKFETPILAAVQIPVNMRSFAGIDEDVCLCGSAGVWHTAKADGMQQIDWWEVAKDSTTKLRAALQEDQPNEWLRRLLHAPATLPRYSMMVSSIGVAPIKASYGKLQVEKFNFFGANLRTEKPSHDVASMIHAVTFRDEFHCLFNFTSPGISKAFAKNIAKEIKDNLLSFTRG